MISNCPNCSAPIIYGYDHNCPYCNTFIKIEKEQKEYIDEHIAKIMKEKVQNSIIESL